ncbi:hypothetical protein BGZ68_007096, partial [Mortierella alpina]
MGIRGFYCWLRKKKNYDPVLRVPTHSPLPVGATLRLDVLSFFNKIRWIYTRYKDDKVKAHSILFEHLKQFGDPAHTVYYVDGYPAIEKEATHRVREEKRNDALKTAKAALDKFKERVSDARPPTKELFKKADKGLRGGFKWSIQDRRDFVEFLQGQDHDARFCETEADIAIAADCRPVDIVVSQDSDFFAYESVKVLWRPVGKKHEVKILEYNKAAVLEKVDLSHTKLTALACVSCNDYNKNIRSLGIATNYKIIKDLPDGAVPWLLQAYLQSPLVIWSNEDDIDFTGSLLVFTTMTQVVAQSEAPPMDPVALPMSFEVLCQQYESVKGQYASIKAEKRATSSSN